MLNLKFQMLNQHRNIQFSFRFCLHLHSENLHLVWREPGNSGSLVLWSYVCEPKTLS